MNRDAHAVQAQETPRLTQKKYAMKKVLFLKGSNPS